MTARHALVIGIPAGAPESRLEPIPEDVVRTDVTQMCRALAQSGYEITVLGVCPEEDVNARHVAETPTLNRVRTELANAFDRVPAGGTLIVYFSGHGVRLGGADYLVPSDGGGPDRNGQPDPDSLIPVHFGKATAGCQAGTVVCFIDACRNVPTGDNARGEQRLPELPGGSFVLVRGCAPEQACRWEEGQGSMFTRALVRGLHRNASARTLHEVLEATRSKLRELDPDDPQRPHHVWSGSGDGVMGVTICEGVRFLDDLRVAVDETRLWDLVGDAAAVEPVRAAVRRLVDECGQAVQRQRGRLAQSLGLEDRWSDDAYPRRVLDSLLRLLTRPHEPAPRLHPAEAAVLVAAPFLREAVLALGLHKVPEVQPRDFTRRFGTGLRADFENVLADHEQLARRAAGLPDERAGARDDLAMWLAHRWILEREDLWETDKARAWCRDLAEAALAGADPRPGPGRIGELGDVLRELVRCLTGVLIPDNEPRMPGGGDIVRPRPLGYLLSVAGVMGGDPRRMSGVLADHVGAHDPIDLRGLHEALAAEVSWRRAGQETVLDAVCRHPAVHAALEELAEEADDACRHACRAREGMVDASLLEGVPTRCVEGLRPERNAYDKPLLRFHLAGDRVRDLLMGTQLYGDAEVAVRELYQNALDACRYRHMRLRYTTGQEDPPGWRGRIVFRQDVDEAGREYIECEDNGVGMTESVLRHAFTAAGTRFVHTSAFRREEARWRRGDPKYRLYPNSQFGIGVFSYFMLADEAILWTTATDESGAGWDDRYELRIPGHGGLFHVRREVEVPAGIKTGGTVVRLLLSAGLAVDAMTALATHLVVSDYDVEVWRHGELVRTWTPGVPQHDEFNTAVPHPGIKRVWWIDGSARVLSDGILVDAEDRGYGWLVDLTGPQQPRLSVDRRQILSHDTEWIQESLVKSIPALATWKRFTFTWMWKLTGHHERLAQRAFEAHRELSIPYSAVHPVRAVLGRAGSLALDSQPRPDAGPLEAIWAWRATLWRSIVAALPPIKGGLAGPVEFAGFPTPDPADAALFARIDSAAARSRMLHWPEDSDEFPPWPFDETELRYRLRRFVLAGLRLDGLRGLDDDLFLLCAAVGWETSDDDVPVPIRLLVLAARLQVSLAAAVSLFAGAAAAAGDELPVLESGADLVPDRLDLLLLSRDLDGLAPWIDVLTEAHVDRVLAKTGLDRAQVERRVAALAAAGLVRIPAAPFSAAGADVYLAGRTRAAGPVDVSRYARRAGCTVAEAFAGLSEAAGRLGLPAPYVYGDVLPDVCPEAEDISRIEGDDLGGPPSLSMMVNSRRRYFTDESGAAAAAFFARNAHAFDPPAVIDGAEVFAVAVTLGASVGRAVFVLEELVADWPGSVPVAAASPLAAQVRPEEAEADALLRMDQGRCSWRRPSPAEIAELAADWNVTLGERLGALAPYRDLGAVIPEVDADTAGYRPDRHDGALLRVAMAGEEDWTVSPLRLVLAAGRYGFTVVQAYDRIARFRGYGVGLGIAREDCPDHIVEWPDPLVLTEYLDGAEPALAGVVSAAAVRKAAQAVREAPGVTRERLLRYAALFGLQVEELT